MFFVTIAIVNLIIAHNYIGLYTFVVLHEPFGFIGFIDFIALWYFIVMYDALQ